MTRLRYGEALYVTERQLLTYPLGPYNDLKGEKLRHSPLIVTLQFRDSSDPAIFLILTEYSPWSAS